MRLLLGDCRVNRLSGVGGGGVGGGCSIGGRSLQGERRRGGKTGGAIEEQGEREMYETK